MVAGPSPLPTEACFCSPTCCQLLLPMSRDTGQLLLPTSRGLPRAAVLRCHGCCQGAAQEPQEHVDMHVL